MSSEDLFSGTEDEPGNGGKVKTLAIRLEPEVHSQLSLIAELKGSTITGEIRTAIEAHVKATKADPEFAVHAAAVLEDIERQIQQQAAVRRETIANLLGSSESPQTASGGRTRSRKSGKDEEASES